MDEKDWPSYMPSEEHSIFWRIVTYFYYSIGLIILLKIYKGVTCSRCTSDKRLDGQVVIVTGATCGIGKETALDLARRGAKVILACRDLEKANEVKDEIIEKTDNRNIIVRHLDLASLASVRKFASEVNSTENRLDVLVNNAGAGGLPNRTTDDGLELGMQVNHYAPFLLTYLLIDLLKKSAPSRIVHVSSLAHKWGEVDFDNMNFEKKFGAMQLYFDSKLYNLICSNEFARRLEGTGVTSNSLHPGTVKTEIMRRMPALMKFAMSCIMGLYCKNAEEGAQTSIYLAVSDDVASTTGKYFADCKETSTSKIAEDREIAKKLFDKCVELVRLSPEERKALE